jgi:hypothetical protein
LGGIIENVEHVAAGHADIEQRGVCLLPGKRHFQFARVDAFRHDLHIGNARDVLPRELPCERLVIGDNQAQRFS